MDIDKLVIDEDSTYYSPSFMKLIEDNLTNLRKNKPSLIELTNVQCVKYAGDFYGLLLDLRIERKYHYAAMRVNNYLNPLDFKGDVSILIIPNLPEIDLWKNILQTKKAF